MIYIIIFLVANAIGVLAGYFTAKTRLKESVLNKAKGYLHLIREDEKSPPYIFLEIKDEVSFNELLLKSDYVTMKIIRE